MLTGNRRSLGIVGALALSLGLLATVPVAAASSAPVITEPYRPDAILVRFADGSSPTARAAARASVGAAGSQRIAPNAPQVQLVRLPKGSDVPAAIARLQADPSVLYAEPDYLVRTLATSDDPYYTGGSLWGMHGDGIASGANAFGTGADEAWAAGETGSTSVVVGVIDEGQQWSHPDLASNEWVNPGESGAGKETDGKDNDGNGYIDDVHGWDFYSGDNSTYDGTGDDHGTHVSGTIGGDGGNGAGVAGVNWDVSIIPAKFLGPNGGYTSGAVSALYYLIDLKSRHALNLVATSNSWGGGGYTQTLLDAINAAGNAGMLFVAAAGNASSNIDSRPSYPASYVCSTSWGDCVISVAAISSSGGLASFSNYGASSVDLGAPGVGIWSTVPSNTYASYSGTSMATPHVSGAVALCASIEPTATPAQLRAWVLDGTPTSSLAGKTVTGDRLDVGRLARICAGTLVTYNLTLTVSGRGSVSLAAVGYATQSCSSSCVRSYDAGTSVTLTATASRGYRFTGWAGACTNLSGTCTVSLAAARSVTATFAK